MRDDENEECASKRDEQAGNSSGKMRAPNMHGGNSNAAVTGRERNAQPIGDAWRKKFKCNIFEFAGEQATDQGARGSATRNAVRHHPEI